MGHEMSYEASLVVLELRRHRKLLDELNAELRRASEEQVKMFDGRTELLAALRTNPTRETADAYFACYDRLNSTRPYERYETIDRRRRAVRDAMADMHKKLHELLGVAVVQADWERP